MTNVSIVRGPSLDELTASKRSTPQEPVSVTFLTARLVPKKHGYNGETYTASASISGVITALEPEDEDAKEWAFTLKDEQGQEWTGVYNVQDRKGFFL